MNPVNPLNPPSPRLSSVDALRGIVMVIMALDHTRDFFHAGAMAFSPEDLTRTSAILFLTRWVTHICAPTFMLLAGAGAFLRLERTGRPALSRFLLSRGLWLVILELTVMRLAMNFTFSLNFPWLLLVVWALGISMMALAAVIWLPRPVLLAVAVIVIALHNTLDGVQAAQFGAFAGAWNVLHQPGVFMAGGLLVFAAYPLVPWIAVMALGFWLGPVLVMEPARRRRILLVAGAAMCAGFVLLRGLNVYGDPAPWSLQPSPLFTLLSFIRTTKYPPSLQFLLMTLGPALIGLALLDGCRRSWCERVAVIGRVPLFFFVAHFWALHVLASFMARVRYGSASHAFLFSPLPSMGGSRDLFPAGFGYPLWVTFAVWIFVVLALYPLCRWFAALKSSKRAWWLSYM